jgi:hypothetical protein
MTDPLHSNPLPGTGETPAYTPTDDERVLAILCHVLALFFWIFPALIIYLLKKDESAFIAYHAKESMNFQITMGIILIVLLLSIVGLLLVWLWAVLVLVFVIVASIKTSDKKLYRYPMTIRLIK